MNNLLERLHASFFFYVMTSVRTFVKFGGYLASAILVSVSMIFGGLRLWVVAGWEKYENAGSVVAKEPITEKEALTKEKTVESVQWKPRERPVLIVLGVMLATHFAGWVTFLLITSPVVSSRLQVSCGRMIINYFG